MYQKQDIPYIDRNLKQVGMTRICLPTGYGTYCIYAQGHIFHAHADLSNKASSLIVGLSFHLY